jgi:hypothetical protein
MDDTRVIRPAAVLPEHAAVAIVDALNRLDVAHGGVWNASSAIWQRYDQAWDCLGGVPTASTLLGSICVAYDTPTRYSITIYRVTVSGAGLAAGWTVDRLCDDALIFGGLTLANCPRAPLAPVPRMDPFQRSPSAASRPIPGPRWSPDSGLGSVVERA